MQSSDLPDEVLDVISQYRTLHETKKWFPGKLKSEHITHIAALIQATEATTLLDYGCGKGTQYLEKRQHEGWGGILPVCYDPGYYPYSLKPTMIFDGVICTEVMEHIPESAVLDILTDVIGYARKFVFFSIGTRVSRKKLPDGRSVHLTIKPKEWWLEQVSKIEHTVTVDATFDG